MHYAIPGRGGLEGGGEGGRGGREVGADGREGERGGARAKPGNQLVLQ